MKRIHYVTYGYNTGLMLSWFRPKIHNHTEFKKLENDLSLLQFGVCKLTSETNYSFLLNLRGGIIIRMPTSRMQVPV